MVDDITKPLSASLSQNKMTDRAEMRVTKFWKIVVFSLQSKVEQHPAVTSLLDATTFSLCYPRDSGKVCFCYCGPNGNEASPHHVSCLPFLLVPCPQVGDRAGR